MRRGATRLAYLMRAEACPAPQMNTDTDMDTYRLPPSRSLQFTANLYTSACRVLLSIGLLLTVVAPIASAQEGDDVDLSDGVSAEPMDPGKVDAFYGAYTESIPIEIPAFRGLEPKISLSYNSSGRNGYVGMGWSLSGFSVIERASPGRGAGRYNPSATVQDIWLLDGQELIPCASGSLSPSCVIGSAGVRGTHSTRIENYQRIRFEPAYAGGARWVITDQRGTQYIYSMRHSVGGEVFQYWLERIVDTRGNTVIFGYNLDNTNNWLYPGSISYNRTIIRLYNQDPATTLDHRVQRATGKGIATMVRRLGSIVVSVQAPPSGVSSGEWQVLRAYQLSYTSSSYSKRSLLSSVRQFGRGAGFDLVGNVSGASLPARTFAWKGEVLGPSTTSNSDPQTAGSYSNDVHFRTFKDINGDSRSDLLLIGGSNSGAGATLRWAHSNGNGTYASLRSAKVAETGTYRGDNFKTHAADVNGDGLADAVFMWGSSTTTGAKVHVALARPAPDGASFLDNTLSTYSLMTTGRYTGAGWRNKFMADVNGDGRDDAVFVYSSATSNTGVKIAASLASAPSGSTSTVIFSELKTSIPQSTGNFVTNWKRSMADVNGDGRMDMVWLFHGTGTKVAVSLSNGDGTFSALQTSTSEGSSNYNNEGWDGNAVMSDINGDGKSDAVWLYGSNSTNTNGTRVHVRLSNGDGSFAPLIINSPRTAGTYLSANWSARSVVDFNGDGLPDVVWIYSYRYECGNPPPGYACNTNENLGRQIEVALNLGDGRFAAGQRITVASSGYFGTPWSIHMADVDGNGVFEPVWLLLGQVASELGQYQHSNWVNLGVRVRATLASTTRLLLTNSYNGYGGSTQVTYSPSSAWANQTMPLVTDTVSSIRTDPGFGQTADRYATTYYTYKDGLYDALSRRFLGFRTVARKPPCVQGETVCPSDVTVYSQNYGSISKPVLIHRLDGSGWVLSASQYEYTETTHGPVAYEGPFVSQLLRTLEYTYTPGTTLPAYPAGASWLPCPSSTCRRSLTEYGYDYWWSTTVNPADQAERSRWRFGQTTAVVSYGDIGSTDGAAGSTTDDNLEYTYRTVNPEKFIVLPAMRRVYRSPWNSEEHLMTAEGTHYDNQIYWYNQPSVGNATTEWKYHKESNSFTTRASSYDGYGNVRSATDERGFVTLIHYDTVFNLFQTRITRASGRPEAETTEMGWSFPCGLQDRKIGANGADEITTTQYDAFCRKIRIDEPLGSYRTWAYLDYGSPSNQRIVESEPSDSATVNIITERRFDGYGRTTRTRTNNQTCEFTRYNARGKIRHQRAAAYDCSDTWSVGVETFYDALDRPVRTVMPNGTSVETRYTAGWTYRIDENGKWWAQLLDLSGHILSDAYHLDGAWRYTNMSYDAVGRLIQVTDPSGNVWRNFYDSLGNKIQESDPNRGTTYYGYYADGKLGARIDARGQRTDWIYDGLGRKLRETLRSGTPQAEIYTWAYDQARSDGSTVYRNKGRLTSQSDPSGVASFDYDLAGNLVKRVRSIDGAIYTFRHGYYPGRRLKWTTYPDNSTLGTASNPLLYDSYGRLEWLPEFRVGASYNAAGLVAGISSYQGDYFGGCGSPDVPRIRQAFAYDSLNRLTRVDVQKQIGYWTSEVPDSDLFPCYLAYYDETKLADYSYAYTNTNRIQAITNALDANDTRIFGYDEVGRLRSATAAATFGGSQSFAYDYANNMTFNSRLGNYAYPAQGASSIRPHAVSTAGGNSYSYDAAGNMISRAGVTMSWDGANRLAGFGGAAYAYDGDGGRLKKISGGIATHYPAPDYEVTAGVVTRYGSIAGKKVAKRTGATTHWLNTDHLGSVEFVTDSSRNVVQRLRNHAFGERGYAQSGLAEQTGFLGELRDGESGLIYQRVRYYDPILARYTSPDTLDVSNRRVGTNRYAYSLNDPVNMFDDGNQAYERQSIIPSSLLVWLNETYLPNTTVEAQIHNTIALASMVAFPAEGVFAVGSMGGRAASEMPLYVERAISEGYHYWAPRAVYDTSAFLNNMGTLFSAGLRGERLAWVTPEIAMGRYTTMETYSHFAGSALRQSGIFGGLYSWSSGLSSDAYYSSSYYGLYGDGPSYYGSYTPYGFGYSSSFTSSIDSYLTSSFSSFYDSYYFDSFHSYSFGYNDYSWYYDPFSDSSWGW
ncbi:MAG: hypothetical protein E6Q88_15100 [Lysobacteraceae bacterium]|nr:MAG: hypothetical protein E6Q88_15100 [Xanthomonadaceae bacterium]